MGVTSCQLFRKSSRAEFFNPVVIRTDFSNDDKWKLVRKAVVSRDPRFGFRAYVQPLSDSRFEKKLPGDLREKLDQDSTYNHNFFFIADSLTINSSDNLILCITLYDLNGSSDRFSVRPKDMWEIENNLSTGNLLFDELLDSVDEFGIYCSPMN